MYSLSSNSISKLLVVCSALNLEIELGATPAWWQLMKALFEEGVELVVLPYRGRAIRSLWWRCYKNPCYYEGEFYAHLLKLTTCFPITKNLTRQKRESIVPKIANMFIKPKWKKHLKKILGRERDIDAVLFLQVPLNHLKGVPTFVRKEFGVPIIYYDGDLPVSLPEYGGYTFNFYIGADLSEFDAFIVNSEGVIPRLKEMGAINVYAVHYGVDPSIYRPLPLPKDMDIFYSGLGAKFREKWIDSMITFPSEKLNGVSFVVAGLKMPNFGDNVQSLPMLPFNQWLRYCCRSKITLNIARESHAMTPGTSSSRPFELAALGCCIISNPYLGLKKWFEIGKELLVVNNTDEAVEVYRWLLADEEIRSKIGQAARERVLKEHTFRHRAQQLLSVINKVISKN